MRVQHINHVYFDEKPFVFAYSAPHGQQLLVVTTCCYSLQCCRCSPSQTSPRASSACHTGKRGTSRGQPADGRAGSMPRLRGHRSHQHQRWVMELYPGVAGDPALPGCDLHVLTHDLHQGFKNKRIVLSNRVASYCISQLSCTPLASSLILWPYYCSLLWPHCTMCVADASCGYADEDLLLHYCPNNGITSHFCSSREWPNFC